MTTNQLQKNIPNGWIQENLGNLINIKKGLTYKSSDYGDIDDGVPFLTLKSVSKGGGFNTEGIKYFKGYYQKTDVIKENDLVIANTDLTRDGDVVGAPMFIPKISDKDMLISMDLSVLEPKENKIKKKFLYYYLYQEYVREYMRGISAGSTVLHLNVNHVPRLKMIIPSKISEQEKIAEILSKVDEDIEKTEKIIEEAKKLKNGLTRELLTNNIKNKDWVIVPIKKAPLEMIDGDRGVNYPKQTDFSNDDYCLFLTNKNVKNDSFDFSESQFISKENDNKLRKGKLNRYDCILTTRGTVGTVAFYDKDVVYENIRINSGMLIFRTKSGFDPRFLYQLLKSEFLKKRYKEMASGSAQPQLPIRSLENIIICYPKSIDEQKEIAEILSSVDEKISINKKLKEKLTQLKKGLMSDLLSGKVRV